MAMSRSFGGTIVDHPVADADFAGGDVLQPRDHAQQGGLAAAGRADQDDEFAVANGDIDAVNDGVAPKALRTSWIATDAIRSPGGARRHTVAFQRVKHVAAALMKSRANAITQARL